MKGKTRSIYQCTNLPTAKKPRYQEISSHNVPVSSTSHHRSCPLSGISSIALSFRIPSSQLHDTKGKRSTQHTTDALSFRLLFCFPMAGVYGVGHRLSSALSFPVDMAVTATACTCSACSSLHDNYDRPPAFG